MSRAAIVTHALRYRCTICGEVLDKAEYGTMRVTQGNRSREPVCSRNACQARASARLAEEIREATS